MADVIRAHLFGTLVLRGDAEGDSLSDAAMPLPASAAARSLLAYLLLHRERPHARSVLAGIWWPDLPESRARRALSQALWHIRRALPDIVAANGDAIHIPPEAAVWVDVAAFCALLEPHLPNALPQHLEKAGHPFNAERLQIVQEDLRQAIQLYRGDLLEGFYDDWVMLERERLRELYLQALESLSYLESAAGHYEAALEFALDLTRADPLREAAHRQLMRLYTLLNRPEAALQQFAVCRQILRAELDLEPGPETVTLAQDIMSHRGHGVSGHLAGPGLRSGPVALGRTRPHPIPLVGREERRAQLLKHIERIFDGEGGVVLVEGEAGVGKTRLLETVAQDARRHGAQVLWGNCKELVATPPYGPLLEALAVGLSAGRAGQLIEVVESIWLQVLSPLLPPLAAALPDKAPLIAIDPAHERARLVEAFVHLLAGWSRIAPLVLVMEDLHWADEETLDVLISLARRLGQPRPEPSRRNGVILIGTYRGEDIPARPAIQAKLRILANTGRGDWLVLQRLDKFATGELIRRYLELNRSAPLFEARIYQETEGNPLFVLETLRALYEEGQLYQDEQGVWHTPWDETTRDYVELRVPSEVSRVIARRLERLGPEERAALNAAAVLERDFTFALLHRTNWLAQSATLRALNELLARQLLVEDRATYRFSHDKIREVVYSALEAAERQDLHRRAAAALEALHPERVELLAYHFERGQVKDKAAHYHRQAGERAAAGHGHVTALSHYNRAVALAEDARLPANFRFALRAGREATLDVLGRREDQAADLQAMVGLARGDSGRLAKVHRRRAWLLAHTSRYDEAEAAAGQALALAESQGDEAAQAAALTALGMTINWRGEPARAIPHLRAAVELSQRAADLQPAAQAHQALANALLGVKAFAEARTEAETALSLRETLHDRPGQAEAFSILGIICMEQGATQDAVAYYRRALEICRAIGYRYGEARNLLNLGNVLYFEGQISQALDQYDQAANIFQSIGHGRGEASTRVNAASVRHTIIGDEESAMRDAEAALAYYRGVGDRGGEGQGLVVLGEIAFQRGDLKTARSHVAAGIAALQAVGERWMEAQARRVSVSLWLAEGRPDKALHALETAEALCQSLGMEDLTVSLFALRGEVLLALGQPKAALAATTEAVARLNPGVERTYLIYFRHYQALLAAGREEEAHAALEQAHRDLLAVIAGLSPEQQQMSLERVPAHRAIVAAWEAAQPRRPIVRLPRADAPTGRPLRNDEYVDVTWTVAAPEDRAIRKRVDRRRHRLLRMLREAHAQGAAPTYAHLAEALGAGLRTIERDMAALRQTHPNLPPTRGAREHGSSGAGENSSQRPSSPAH